MEVLPGNAINSFFDMSMKLLLFVVLLKLISMVIADIYTSILNPLRDEPVHSVHHEERLTVQPAQSKRKVDFIDPVQVATTSVTTERNIEQITATSTKHHACNETVLRVPRGERFPVQIAQRERVDFIAPVQVAATCVKTEPMVENATPPTRHQARNEPVETAQSKSVDYIGAVQVAATCVKAEPKIEKAMARTNHQVSNEPVQTVESESRVNYIDPVQVTATCVKTEHTIEKTMTTKHQDGNEPVRLVKTTESETRVDNIDPVQVVTCVETEHKKEEAMPTTKHQARDDPVPPSRSETGVEYTDPVQAATCVKTEHKKEAMATTKHEASNESVLAVCCEEGLTVQTAPNESRVDFINPVQVATTCVTTEQNIGAIVKSDSNVFVESPVKSKSGSDVGDEEKIDEGSKELEDSAEQRNEECGEEMSVEALTEIEVSVGKEKEKEKEKEEEEEEEEEKKQEEEEEEEDDDDDDWEGIERSELEKVFMAATKYVGGNGIRLASFGSNVQMDLYGLHKVATEGPCRDPHPLPLMFSARAKWNAWQKLGNMSPEVAMEQFISLLSDKFPGWMEDTSAGMSDHEPTGSEVSVSAAPDLCTSLSHQQLIITGSEIEQDSGAQDRSPPTESRLENNVKR